MVGDGHAMGIAAEILQDICGTTEGPFQVHHPVFSVEWPQPGSENLGLRQKFQVGLEVELTILEGQFERVDEFATKDFCQHFLGQEVFFSGANPAGVIRREAAGGNDAMDMRMEAPTPTVP